MSTKRKDIQWLRAFAILAVLGFHILPDIFPNGYLGVDVFFVISGYLMTTILSKPSDRGFTSKIKIFYSRRICRIFPSYFIVINGTLLLGRYILIELDYTFLIKEFFWAIFFGTNLKSFFEEDSYFKLTANYRFLLHTWSLGVEIQFYLMAPMLLAFVARQPWLKAPVLISLSLIAYIWFAENPWSFGFVFCRLWQFLAGTIAHYLIPHFQLTKESKVYKMFYIFSILILSLICFGPTIVSKVYYQPILRILTTFITVNLIVWGISLSAIIPEFWSSVLVYIGDISYSVYLVHWPILLFAKYMGFKNDNSISIVSLIPIIFITAILQYHLFEQKLAKQVDLIKYLIIAFLFINALYMTFENSSKIQPSLPSMNINIPLNDSEAIKINQEMVIDCNHLPIKCEKDSLLKASFGTFKRDDNLEGRCVMSLSPNGTKTAIVLGNSYAMRHMGAIVTTLKASNLASSVSKVYLVSWKGCPIFESTFHEVPPTFKCEQIKGLLLPFLKQLKPDLIFMLNRLDFLLSMNKALNSSLPDKSFQALQNDFLQITNLSSTTIVLEPHHTIGDSMKAAAITITKLIAQKRPLLGLEKNATEVHEQLKNSWARMKQAITPCKSCYAFETLHHFCNQTICETFDRVNRLAYFCDGYHFTPVATGKLVGPLIELINKLKL